MPVTRDYCHACRSVQLMRLRRSPRIACSCQRPNLYARCFMCACRLGYDLRESLQASCSWTKEATILRRNLPTYNTDTSPTRHISLFNNPLFPIVILRAIYTLSRPGRRWEITVTPLFVSLVYRSSLRLTFQPSLSSPCRLTHRPRSALEHMKGLDIQHGRTFVGDPWVTLTINIIASDIYFRS